MKKVLIFTLILVFAFAMTAFAGKDKNIKAGDILVGGGTDLGFGMGSMTITPDVDDAIDQEHSLMNFGLNGYAGYFVIDGLELGPTVEFDYSKNTMTWSEGDDEVITTTTEWAIGLQVGYFLDLDSIAVPYGMLGFGYAKMGTTADVTEVDDDGDTVETTNEMDASAFKIGPKLGVNLFFTNKIALDLGLYMDYYMNGSGTETETDEDDLDFDFTEMDYGLAVGFNVFF